LPPNPDLIDYALVADGVKTAVQNSTVAGYQDGIESSGNGGSLNVTNSSVLTPTPASPGLSLNPVAAVWTLTPATIVDSRLSGIEGLFAEATQVVTTRSVLFASGAGAILRDTNSSASGSMTLRDSVIDVVGDPVGSAEGAGLTAIANNDPTPPTLSLVGDTVFARSTKSPAALDVSRAAVGSNVNVRNTILHAIDTSGHNAANDILAGSNALTWNVGTSDYAEVAGHGVPPAGSGTNLNAPPDFVNDNGSNLRLASTSTLFDKGDPTLITNNETDVTGAPRSVPHVCGGPALPDLGAFEAATPACPPPGGTPAPTPSISHFSQSHKKWRTGSQAAALTASKHKKHKKKAPVGTTFSFTLNTPASATLTFTEATKGRKGKGGKCVAQTKHNRHKHACKRTITAGALTFANAAAGTDSISFAGKLSNHKKLKAGRYTVAIEATNSSGHSGTAKLHFTIVKR
jgi:hypothetical protein